MNDDDMDIHAKQEVCCGVRIHSCILIVVVLAVVCILLTLAAVLAGTIVGSQKDSLHRIGIAALAANVVGAPGEGTYQADGILELNENDNAIRWRLHLQAGMSTVTSLVLRGPFALGVRTGPIVGILCGASIGPSVVCDLVSVPGQVVGAVAYEISDNVTPGGVDIRPLMHDIRENCHLYYLEVLTNAKPTSPGALRASLCTFAGWA